MSHSRAIGAHAAAAPRSSRVNVTVLRHPPTSSGAFLRALHPAQLVVLLIATSTIVRVIFASSLGLGIDESYAVATGRQPQLSYFDHPPLSWWLPWASAQLLGTEAPLAVRLPFIALFALTTWLMFALTRLLFDLSLIHISEPTRPY